MIRYKLKDRELQAAYEKCLKDFDHHLQIACEGFDDEEETVVLHHLCKMTDKPLIAWELTISKKEIEPVEEYDPHAWNNYPKVTPPEGVLMRIEGQYAKRPELEYYGALMYLEGAWHFADTVEIADNVIVERFRPWDDESAK
jgi:hypothetical protein|nr:MAG TPA_asm: hypothetical protein [Caudoviricetes sp.]